MARAPHSPRTHSPGPGRPQRRRARSAPRPNTPQPKAAAVQQKPRWQGRLKLTRRALALGLVVLALSVSFFSTFQIYLRQQQDLAVADQAIRDRTAQIAQLESDLARWNDPLYVKAQARQRLGWVMPGETGYRVVDDNGNPVAGGVALEPGQKQAATEPSQSWWQRLSGSIATADSPVRRVATR